MRQPHLDELLALKNLGRTSVLWLHACGIHSAHQLREHGAVNCYLAVRARGFRASKTFLYSLHAALLDIDWLDLDATQKQTLLEQITLEPALGAERTAGEKNSAKKP